MKATKYRLSMAITFVGFVTVYGILLIFDSSTLKSHQGWSVLKWAGASFAIGMGALVLEWVLDKVFHPIIGPDQTTDPIWKRGLRAFSLITLFSAVIIGLAALRM